MPGLALLAGAYDVLLVGNDFARLGFLAGLQVGVVQEVHGVGLVVGLGHTHFRGVGGGTPGRKVRGDGVLP